MHLDLIAPFRQATAWLRSIPDKRRRERELKLRIERTREGRRHFQRLAAQRACKTITPQVWERLTKQQVAIARELINYETYREIAAALGISHAAVQSATRHIRAITGIYNREDLVYAIGDYLDEHPEQQDPPDERP